MSIAYSVRKWQSQQEVARFVNQQLYVKFKFSCHAGILQCEL